MPSPVVSEQHLDEVFGAHWRERLCRHHPDGARELRVDSRFGVVWIWLRCVPCVAEGRDGRLIETRP